MSSSRTPSGRSQKTAPPQDAGGTARRPALSFPVPEEMPEGSPAPGKSCQVAFIIPCYQSLRTVGFTLKSIFRQVTDLSFQVLVVDSSGRPVSDWFRLEYPSVRVLASARRLFPGAARNLGVRHSQAPYLAFLDADTVADPHWLQTVYQRCRQPGVRVVGGAVANGNPVSTASRSLYWLEFSEFLPGLASGFRRMLSSSNLFLSREVFDAAGGFDEGMAMAEDLLFSERIGQGLYFESDAQVRHHHRTRWSEVLLHLKQLGYWSGRYRRAGTGTGSFLRRIPLLSLALPCVRFPRLARRVFQSQTREGLSFLAHTPWIWIGLAGWSWGFYRGIRGD